MSSFISNEDRAGDSSPKSWKSTATTRIRISLISVRSTSGPRNMHERRFPLYVKIPHGPDYVLTLHQPENRVAILVRNRARAQTIQRILLAEDIADSRIQDWLKEQNNAGADIFLGMNPLRANSFARTKESVREIRHVYLDLDADAPASLRTIRTDGNTPVPTFVLDTSPEKNQVVWRVDGLDRQ